MKIYVNIVRNADPVEEEMAVKLHVVRQTISKWETNLSVPDADMLVEIAKVLQVSR